MIMRNVTTDQCNISLSLPHPPPSPSLPLSSHYKHYQMHNYKHCSYLWQVHGHVRWPYDYPNGMLITLWGSFRGYPLTMLVLTVIVIIFSDLTCIKVPSSLLSIHHNMCDNMLLGAISILLNKYIHTWLSIVCLWCNDATLFYSHALACHVLGLRSWLWLQRWLHPYASLCNANYITSHVPASPCACAPTPGP